MTRHALHVTNLHLDTPHGRPVLRDLNLALEAGDRVALVGRNGVGKSTLVSALVEEPSPPSVRRPGTVRFVPQTLSAPAVLSPGQHRLEALRKALEDPSDLLVLDEPTQDLDARAVNWLCHALPAYSGALLVVSHDVRLLAGFGDFFVLAEHGCQHVSGNLALLQETLRRQERERRERYRRQLERLDTVARGQARDEARQERKRQRGRATEVARRSPRAVLNSKRSTAQESRAKRTQAQEFKVEQLRALALTARRSLAITLPLRLTMPHIPAPSTEPIAQLEATAGGHDVIPLWSNLTLSLGHERWLITGDNGSGKSTLARVLVGELAPLQGRVRRDLSRIGYIAQGARNLKSSDSLVEILQRSDLVESAEAAIQRIDAHRFPLGLASRPLASLSPGERLRAGLLSLTLRHPPPELLVLDEPTDGLDLPGQDALAEFLKAWPYGLVVITHDPRLLQAVRFDHQLTLTNGGPHKLHPHHGRVI